jgi:SAM-dependent methyltransferase
MKQAPDFDAIARAYRWMEYFSFGPFLERCRFAQLDHLGNPQRALVLGDGDGRFLARLLERYPDLIADSVDLSPAMIGLAKERIGKNAVRVQFHIADIRTFSFPPGAAYNLVAAHFFLDCLSESEVRLLFDRLAPHIRPSALCVLSEFAIPSRGPLRIVARLLVRSLYFAFHLLTGLSVRMLPDYPSILRSLNVHCEDNMPLLGGILRSERWRFHG